MVALKRSENGTNPRTAGPCLAVERAALTMLILPFGRVTWYAPRASLDHARICLLLYCLSPALSMIF